MKAFLLKLRGDKRNCNRKYSINYEVFNHINLHSAYWAGFIAADGHITDGYQIMIKLARKDKSHLIALKKFLQYSGPIKDFIAHTSFGSFEQSELCIQSVSLSKALNINFKIPFGNKSFKIKLPNLKDKYLLHFIAGYFDGDGCVYWSKKKHLTITFVSNKIILKQIRDFLNRYFNIYTSMPYQNVKCSEAHMYRIHGVKAQKILKAFNKNPNRLKRKKK